MCRFERFLAVMTEQDLMTNDLVMNWQEPTKERQERHVKSRPLTENQSTFTVIVKHFAACILIVNTAAG